MLKTPTQKLMVQDIFKDINKIKQTTPIVHNLMNLVAMDAAANILLAAGASPIMAHSVHEIDDILSIAQSLVINIGTLDEFWIDSIMMAQKIALSKNIPIIFDPVGAGASKYRTAFANEILKDNVTIVRGNASEIMALAGEINTSKGIDSFYETVAAKDAAKSIAKNHQCICIVSGKVDYITDGDKTLQINNGSHYFQKVTAMGCSLTSLIGAFAAINDDPIQVAINGMSFFNCAGEIAASKAKGPGSFYMHLLDALDNFSEDHMENLSISMDNTA